MVDDQTEWFRVQQREWEPTKENDDPESQLSTALGDPATSGLVTRWSDERFWGLFSDAVTLTKRDHERVVTYSCYKTKRAAKLELVGLMIGICLITVIGVAGGFFEWMPVGYVPLLTSGAITSQTTGLLIVSFSSVIFGLLVGINRGPRPRFPATGLEARYTTYGVSYFLYAGLPVLILGSAVGMWLNQPVIGAIVFTLLYGITVYATNRVPTLSGEGEHTLLEAGSPMFSDTNLHFNVAVLALLPALLGLLSYFITSIVAPTAPSSINRPLWVGAWFLTVPVGLCLLYGYWCREIAKRLENTNPRSGDSAITRGVVALVFGLINIVILLITLVLLILAAGPLLYRVVRVDLWYTPTGIGAIIGLILGLFVTAIGGAIVYQRLATQKTDSERLRCRVVRYTNTLVLFGVFTLLSFFVTNVLIGAVLFGDGGLFDPSARTIRQALETRLVFAEMTAAVPLPVDVRVLPLTILQVLPVFVLGFAWGAHIDHELRERLAIARTGSRLDTEDRPVPDDVPVVVTETGVTTGVQTGLRGSYVLLNQSQIADLLKKELDALLAHEAYHIRNRDSIVDFVALVGSFVFGSDNVLHLFYDLAESEYQADQYAIDRVGGTELMRAIDGHQDPEVSSLPGPGTSTVGFTTAVTERLQEALDTERNPTEQVRHFVITGWQLLSTPASVLFGGTVTGHAHMDPATRKRLCCLSDHLYDWVCQNIEIVSVPLPAEREIVHPIPEVEIYETWRARGAREEQIDEVLAELCEDGKLRRVRDNHLVVPELWQ